jgi:hypothetical protein
MMNFGGKSPNQQELARFQVGGGFGEIDVSDPENISYSASEGIPEAVKASAEAVLNGFKDDLQSLVHAGFFTST